MTEEEWAAHRAAVFGVAYRLLGTVGDAEDVEQDVWLRASKADLGDVRDLRAWLVTVAARRAYDILRSARVRRETYVGPWLPEPLLTGPDASRTVIVDDSVSTAMLLVMERLTPPERVAFVLHDVFETPFPEVAGVLGTSPAAARQLASRGRRKVAAEREQPRATHAERERVLRAFRAAYEAGDIDGLVALLHPDAVYVTDGGGRTKAARKLIAGALRVATALVRVARRNELTGTEPLEVGGETALAIRRDGRLIAIDTFDVGADGRVRTLYRVVNPDKLPAVPPGNSGPGPSHRPAPSRLPAETDRERKDAMSRISVPETSPELYRAFAHVEGVIRKGPLEATVRELVKIRASQLNGCLFCIDMHTHEALDLGENVERIFQLSAWRESALFSPAERAALAYTEAATALPSGVSDEVWGELVAHFKPEETSYIVGQVAMINAWNRIAAPSHTEPQKRD